MSLEAEIAAARKEVSPDGYEMSIGEIISLYTSSELTIHPEYQRLFRWKDGQKTRFIESLLLGIPVPPIFVFQDSAGIWELIDGLQRLSTIFEFVGILKSRDGSQPIPPSVLSGTKFLPSLQGCSWSGGAGTVGIGKTLQLEIRRTRMRVEILRKVNDPSAKYELFQRLNTGGTALTEQEVRNCTALMINPALYKWMVERSQAESFVTCTKQTEEALKQQAGIELVLRFLAFRLVPYQPGLDVHEYLDEALIKLATDPSIDFDNECSIFDRTFKLLADSLGSDSFRRWDGQQFTGKFLQSLYETVAIGLSRNLAQIEGLGGDAHRFIKERTVALWSEPTFIENSGAGVRGTTRLAKLLPLAEPFFKP